MAKKIYKQPSLKVIELDYADIIATSTGIQTFSLIDEDIDDSQQNSISDDIWGKQW